MLQRCCPLHCITVLLPFLSPLFSITTDWLSLTSYNICFWFIKVVSTIAIAVVSIDCLMRSLAAKPCHYQVPVSDATACCIATAAATPHISWLQCCCHRMQCCCRQSCITVLLTVSVPHHGNATLSPSTLCSHFPRLIPPWSLQFHHYLLCKNGVTQWVFVLQLHQNTYVHVLLYEYVPPTKWTWVPNPIRSIYFLRKSPYL